jgi:hypothetical protein
MEQEKVPVADKIISLSDSDASFIVKGGWNTAVGYRPQLVSTQWGRLCHGVCVASRQRPDSPHLVPMAQEQITNTGVIPSMVSARAEPCLAPPHRERQCPAKSNFDKS